MNCFAVAIWFRKSDVKMEGNLHQHFLPSWFIPALDLISKIHADVCNASQTPQHNAISHCSKPSSSSTVFLTLPWWTQHWWSLRYVFVSSNSVSFLLLLLHAHSAMMKIAPRFGVSTKPHALHASQTCLAAPISFQVSLHGEVFKLFSLLLDDSQHNIEFQAGLMQSQYSA